MAGDDADDRDDDRRDHDEADDALHGSRDLGGVDRARGLEHLPRRVARGVARRARRRLRQPRHRLARGRDALGLRLRARLAIRRLRGLLRHGVRRLGPVPGRDHRLRGALAVALVAQRPQPGQRVLVRKSPEGIALGHVPIPPPPSRAVNAADERITPAGSILRCRWSSTKPPTLDDIRQAAARLDGVAHRTPVLTSYTLDALVGAEVLLKAEGLQRGGAFKFRGAYNAIAQLDAPSAGSRRLRFVVGQPRAGRRARRPPVRHERDDPHAARCPRRQARRDRGLRRARRRVRPLRRGSRGADLRARRRARPAPRPRLRRPARHRGRRARPRSSCCTTEASSTCCSCPSVAAA